MEKSARARKNQEESLNGLVILNAVYSVKGGDEIEVTTPLMFLVVNSTLNLPASTKSTMLGFYKVKRVPHFDADYSSLNVCLNLWKQFRWRDSNSQKTIVHNPTLTIRYRYRGEVFEIIYSDEELVSLPDTQAMRLGGPRLL